MSDGISDGFPFPSEPELPLEQQVSELRRLLAKHNLLGIRKDQEIAQLKSDLTFYKERFEEAYKK